MDEATKANAATCKESLQVRALPESDDVAEALAEISAAGLKGVAVGLRLHIKGLTRRLAEVEEENGRFAGRLESSVSDWRKLYTEERAERVRIEGILLNDVQDERQESDEHIKGLVTVIKAQDKAIRDLKSRVVELEEENVRLRPRAEIAGSLLTRTSKAEKRCRELEEELTLCLKEAPVGILAAICDMNKILGLEMPKTSYTEIPPAIQAVVARAEAAEARVRELETLKTHHEGIVEKLQRLLLQANLRATDIEAEQDALREQCETLEHELGMSKRNEARWIEKGEEAISERNAANKALEAIKRHQEIVAGTGTAQMSTTWKIADDYLRSRGAALAATEVKS